MISSFTVPDELVAEDRISPILLRLAERFTAIGEQIAALEKRFAGLGNAFGAFVTSKAEAMAGGIQASMAQIDTAIGVTTANIKRMAGALAGGRDVGRL